MIYESDLHIDFSGSILIFQIYLYGIYWSGKIYDLVQDLQRHQTPQYI